jgi:hypothetical protein
MRDSKVDNHVAHYLGFRGPARLGRGHHKAERVRGLPLLLAQVPAKSAGYVAARRRSGMWHIATANKQAGITTQHWLQCNDRQHAGIEMKHWTLAQTIKFRKDTMEHLVTSQVELDTSIRF